LLLLASLAAALLIAVDRLCPGASAWAGRLGRGALMAAAAFGLIAVALVIHEAMSTETAILAGVGALIAVGTWLIGWSAIAPALGPRTDGPAAEDTSVLVTLGAASAVVGLGLSGIAAWQRLGSYTAGPTAAALTAALAGVAAAQPTAFPMLRIAVFMAALAGAVLAQV
jgi:hypothetical protein